MHLEDSFRAAAHAADDAVRSAMEKYRSGLVTDEDDLSGVLLGRLDSAFDKKIGGIEWSSSILRHRKGIAAQESIVGADMLIHISLDTPELRYSKGVLVQAKRVEPGTSMAKVAQAELIGQCKKMLKYSAASFVVNYAQNGVRCASATESPGPVRGI